MLDLSDPGASYSGSSVLGVGLPLAIAVVFLVLGLVLMLVWRFTVGTTFFTRKGFETVSDEVALAALGPTRPGAALD